MGRPTNNPKPKGEKVNKTEAIGGGIKSLKPKN